MNPPTIAVSPTLLMLDLPKHESRADQMIQAVLNERQVYRVDDKSNVQFKPKKYWHNKDWTDSGAGKTGPSGTKNTKAIFALSRKKDAAFYTAPRDTPRASIRKPDGSQHILFQQSDRKRVAGNRPTLSTFSRKNFRKAGQSGELITGKTVKPTSRETIKDPIGFMKKHGRVSFVKDLGKTVSDLRGRGKIVDTEHLPNKIESLTTRIPTATELIEAKLGGLFEGADHPWEMTRDEFHRRFHHPDVKSGYSSAQHGKRLQDVNKDAHVWTYHATDHKTATKFLKDGIKQDDKPRNISRSRFEKGEYAEFAPGRGVGGGLYVGCNPHDIEGYGRHLLAVKTRIGSLRASPEASHLGHTDRSSIAVNNAMIIGDIHPSQIVDLGHRTRLPETAHKEFVKHAIRSGKNVPNRVKAEYPDLDPHYGVKDG